MINYNLEELKEKKIELEANSDQNTDIDKENNIKTEDENIIENNDTLLVSEILGKVILPYRGEEIKQILEKEGSKYNSPEEVIEDKFTRNLSDYKHQIKARYNETIELVTKREGYKKTDAISLALEMMNKRYLHPAIISACRNLDELDVYLDCLEKNELDDFKIFKIKYELHPIIVKNQKDLTEKISILQRILKFFKRTFEKNTKKGKRYI